MAMDFFEADRLAQLWLSSGPVLPDSGLRQLCVRGLWALLLATLGYRLSSARSPRWRANLAVLLALICLVPGPLSPAYWLEMAFSAPSWSSALLCAWWLFLSKPAQTAYRHSWDVQRPARLPLTWALAGMALGWVLALDTFAALPLGASIYAWGFGPLCSALMLLLTAALWLGTSGPVTAVPLLAVGLFILTRLPSGNVWDALIDPWLWLYLHACAAGHWWRRLRGRS